MTSKKERSLCQKGGKSPPFLTIRAGIFTLETASISWGNRFSPNQNSLGEAEVGGTIFLG
jgi:hypothetical protein